MDNKKIAERLIEYANYLEACEASLYRVRAYRRAADTVLALDRPVSEILALDGRQGLEALPGIGTHLSYTLEGLVRTGEFHTLDRDAGHVDPERLLSSLPGVGHHLSRLIHERLGIGTLEELERAAHDGKLGQLGIGPKRLRGIIDSLAGRLGRYRLPEPIAGEPAVGELLAIDREYQMLAERQRLPTISPRRFNPTNEPWLPVLQIRRGGYRYRALFSNTALAHRLGQTRDWVVIYFEDGYQSGQRTVVTETRGELRGRRVVRGRERQCAEYYRGQTAARNEATLIGTGAGADKSN
jgi:hypothetical protein